MRHYTRGPGRNSPRREAIVTACEGVVESLRSERDDPVLREMLNSAPNAEFVSAQMLLIKSSLESGVSPALLSLLMYRLSLATLTVELAGVETRDPGTGERAWSGARFQFDQFYSLYRDLVVGLEEARAALESREPRFAREKETRE